MAVSPIDLPANARPFSERRSRIHLPASSAVGPTIMSWRMSVDGSLLVLPHGVPVSRQWAVPMDNAAELLAAFTEGCSRIKDIRPID